MSPGFQAEWYLFSRLVVLNLTAWHGCAGLLAVRIIGAHRPDLLQRMLNFQTQQCDIVEMKANQLESVGWQKYTDKMNK